MNTTNTTNLPVAAADSGIDLALGGSLLAIDICIIVFNVLTIMVIVRFQTKNAVDVFVLTLALHDLVKGLVPVPITVYVYFSHWRLEKGTVACNLYGWVAFMLNAGSMLILTLMAIERFGAIIKPFAYRAWVSTGKIQMVAFISVVFTGFHSALPLIGVGRIIPYYKGAYSHFDYSRETNGTRHYAMFVLCYGFVMIFIVIITYSFVFYKIRSLIHRHRRMNRISESYNTSGGRELNLKTETMFSYLALVLMLLFMVSWLPFLSVVAASQMDVKIPLENLDQKTMRIVVVNSMLNPLAYVILCKPYRIGILYYIRKVLSLCGFQRPSNDIWDPWRRASLVRRRTDKYTNDKYSMTDSGIGFNESNCMPSTFQSYDTYRAKKGDRYMDSSLSRMEKEACIDNTALVMLPSEESITETHFKDSPTQLLLKDNFETTEDEGFHRLEARINYGAGKQQEHHSESSDLTSEGDITTYLDAVRKSSPHLLNEETSLREEMITIKKKSASLDFQARYHIGEHTSNGLAKCTKDGASVPVGIHLNRIGKGQHHQQQQQQQQINLHMHQKLPCASSSNGDIAEKVLKTRPKSKSTTNLQYEFQKNDNRDKADKKSTSSSDFFLQDSIQPTSSVNVVNSNRSPPNDTLDAGVITSCDPEYTFHNVCVNDCGGSSTPLKDLAKLIRDFDSNENVISVSYRNSKCLFKTCVPQAACDCFDAEGPQAACDCFDVEECTRTCEHCCYKQWASRNELRSNINMKSERTQSLQQLNSCSCMRQKNEDAGREGMECVINYHPFVSRQIASESVIPVDYMRSGHEANHMEKCSTAGSRKSRDFLEIEKLLEKTVLSLYDNHPYDT